MILSERVPSLGSRMKSLESSMAFCPKEKRSLAYTISTFDILPI